MKQGGLEMLQITGEEWKKIARSVSQNFKTVCKFF